MFAGSLTAYRISVPSTAMKMRWDVITFYKHLYLYSDLIAIDDIILVEDWQYTMVDHQNSQDDADHGQGIDGSVDVYFTGDRDD